MYSTLYPITIGMQWTIVLVTIENRRKMKKLSVLMLDPSGLVSCKKKDCVFKLRPSSWRFQNEARPREWDLISHRWAEQIFFNIEQLRIF